MLTPDIMPLFDQYLYEHGLNLEAVIIGGSALSLLGMISRHTLCDRGTDLADCLAMKPSKSEIDDATPWIQFQDTNPDWPTHVTKTLNNLKKKLELCHTNDK